MSNNTILGPSPDARSRRIAFCVGDGLSPEQIGVIFGDSVAGIEEITAAVKENKEQILAWLEKNDAYLPPVQIFKEDE